MQFAFQVLFHTPTWVFILFAYLIWQGIQSLASRSMPVWRVLIVPVVFLLMGLAVLLEGHVAGPWPFVAWLTGAVLLLPLGLATGPRLLGIDPASGHVFRAGSPRPLIRNVLLFALQYSVATYGALHPHDQDQLSLFSRSISGATAGYFIGWAISFRCSYRAASTPSAEASFAGTQHLLVLAACLIGAWSFPAAADDAPTMVGFTIMQDPAGRRPSRSPCFFERALETASAQESFKGSSVVRMPT